MALEITHKDVIFGIGDKVKVIQKIKDGEKERTATFEGIVIKIRGIGDNKMFTTRRSGAQGVGIERIFPLSSPFIEKVEVIKKGTPGVRRSKLYYIRTKSPREIDEIFARAAKRVKKNVPKQK